MTEDRTSLWRLPRLRAVVALSVAAFTSFFATQASLPLWAVSGGTAPAAAGLVTAAMLVLTVATQSLVPGAARRFGAGPVLAAGLVLLGAPTPAYLLHSGLAWLTACSAVRGLGFAVITVLLPLLAIAAAPDQRGGEAIGLYGLSIAVPNLLAVPGGVALTSAHHFAVVAWAGAVPLLALPLLPGLARMMAEPPAAHRDGPTRTMATLKAILGATLVLLATTLAGSGLTTFLPIARPTGALSTLTLLAFGATAAVARWRAGILADRMSSRGLLPIGVALFVLGMAGVGLGLATDLAVVVVIGGLVAGLGFGSVQNLTLVVSFAIAGSANRPAASALWNAAFDSGAAIGALAVGWVAAVGVGYPLSFVGSAALVVLTLPLAVAATRRSPVGGAVT